MLSKTQILFALSRRFNKEVKSFARGINTSIKFASIYNNHSKFTFSSAENDSHDDFKPVVK